MLMRVAYRVLGEQKRSKIIVGFISAILLIGVIKWHSQQEKSVFVRDNGSPRKLFLTSQRLKVELKTRLLTENSTARQHAKFSMEPWKVLSSPIKEKIALDKAQTWVSIVVVKSGIQNKDRRDMIRQTWGAIKFMDGVRFETIFILGKTNDSKAQKGLEEENKQHGDLLQTDIPDNTKNLPLKITAGMWWASQHTKPDWLYSSADDDMVLHPPNFARYVESLARERGGVGSNIMKDLPMICIYGYQTQGKPDRSSSSKWYMSKEMYPDQYWPPYCRGGWYSMPVATATKIYEVSRTTPALYLDDVWLTGIIRLKMYNKLHGKYETGSLLREQGIVGAPLADRTDREFYYRKHEDDISKVIVSHTWGNYGWRPTNVVDEIRNTWEKWKPSVWERMRDVVWYA